MIQLGTAGSATYEVFLACGVTDLRRGFNGLSTMIAHELKGEPRSGQIYVFCNRKRDAVKIYFYHHGGAWVCTKRLDTGTFRWPERGDRTVPMTADALQHLLSGLTPVPVKRVRDRWWQEPGQECPEVSREGHTPAAAAMAGSA